MELRKDKQGRSILGYALYDPVAQEWFRLDKPLFANPHSAKCAVTSSCGKKWRGNENRKFALIVPIVLPPNPEEIGFAYASTQIEGSFDEMAGYLLERDLFDD